MAGEEPRRWFAWEPVTTENGRLDERKEASF